MAAGAEITAQVSQQAHDAINNYAQRRQEELAQQKKNATSPEEIAAIEAERKKLRTDKEMLDVLVGAVTGFGAEALTQATIAKAADYMRDRMIENSKVFPGVTDGTTTISNISGTSVGVDGDGYKIGGTRLDLDVMCGLDSSRCESVRNQDSVTVNFTGDLKKYLNSPEASNLSGLTGGIQGSAGTLAGENYKPGSFTDYWIENFAGPHDYIGGYLPRLYDSQGNARQGQSEFAKAFYSGWTVAAIPIAAPFAMAKGLPPGVWEAMQKLVFSK